MSVLRGYPFPLGGTVEDGGVNFSLFSANATGVTLCLFDPQGEQEIAQYPLIHKTQHIWHGFVEGIQAGQLYGYRINGPYQPHLGHRFNPNKLLLDPYARQLVGQFVPDDRHYGYDPSSKEEDLSFDKRDNAGCLPKCKVVDLRDKNRSQRCPSRPLSDSIIYEMHVKGFTIKHPSLSEDIRGTFAGMADDQVIGYLKNLGINCVELMPVQAFFDEPFLQAKNLTNYWGYNSLGFFAPHPAYLSGQDIFEFRHMVDTLHAADIEVVLDVVYNHSAEGNHLGPTYSFRGIDNASYYRLHPNDQRFYINDTGCGNTLNITHPRVLQLVMDSLRYWVEVMGVDGFRFDLASCLGRESYGFDRGAGFLDAIAQDPVLCKVKLIAEPWDIGPGGYQLGNFPVAWSEWNDRYRDTMRRFWRGDSGMLAEFARRFHGSGDYFEHSGRSPAASINFITSHDGFTLRDLVSFNERHNEMNGENSRDGHQENFSYNYGVEGLTTDPAIRAVRIRQRKNLLTTLILSQGVPMLLAGDEIGSSQQGNNNAYCQDNPLSWRDWSQVEDATSLFEFTRQLIALRQRFALLRHTDFIHQPENRQDPGLFWFSRQGEVMSKSLWSEGQTRTLALMLIGDLEGRQETPNSKQALLLTLNADDQTQTFTFPDVTGVVKWQCLLHTQDNSTLDDNFSITQTFQLQDRSLMLFHAYICEESENGQQSQQK
ncbi:glycogen debranching protein GlgX [Neptunicella sp. SCSIO 80796]|uniref:glycogen debranching protein GlgX n=1 Tax=Neptunicella plasticusilytica TaxID=3117012 RepID=UPI003A4D91BB